MKKFLAQSLVFVFLLSSFSAVAAPKSEAEKIIDDYYYTLTVEWDQKDEAFINRETEAFQDKIQGYVGTEELSSAFKRKIKDLKVLDGLTNLVDQSHTPAEIISVLKTQGTKLYVQGASWSPYNKANAFIVIFILVAIFAR